jgi:sensor domain CHASE-containing protein
VLREVLEMPTSALIRPPIKTDLPHLLVAALGAFCAILGSMVLVGWHLHLASLIQIQRGMAPMQYNTAICFVLAGAAQYIWASGKFGRAIPILGGLIAAIGSLTLVEYLFHADLGVDQAFFHSYITTETSQPGRMSPVSALCFALAGLGFISLGFRDARRWRAPVAGSIASIIISVSLTAVSGYVFGLPGTYGWGQLTRVALHTAVGLGCIGSGIFFMAWNIALRPGERTPRWLPVPLALGIFTGSLVLFFALEGKQNDDAAQTVKFAAQSVKNQMTLRMESRMRAFVRMAQRWEFAGSQTQAAWEADATNYLHDFPDLQSLEWIDTSHRVRWIVPLAGNEGKINLDLTQEERRKAAIDEAVRTHQPVITRIVSLYRGGLGFIIYVPIIVNGQSAGFITAIFDAQECLSRYLPAAVATGQSIEIFDGSQLLYSRDATRWTIREDWVAQQKIELPGATWTLRMWPSPALAARLNSPLPEIVFCAGIICSLLISAVCFLSQRSSRQAAETARANAALQSALNQVKTLEGLLPICSECKRVRDDTGYWNQIDSYISRKTNASLSHGYCPECAAKAFKEYGFEVPPEVQAAVEAGNYE